LKHGKIIIIIIIIIIMKVSPVSLSEDSAGGALPRQVCAMPHQAMKTKVKRGNSERARSKIR